ncbi:MAG: hypothetical protein Q9217_005001 [Psora testacea]
MKTSSALALLLTLAALPSTVLGIAFPYGPRGGGGGRRRPASISPNGGLPPSQTSTTSTSLSAVVPTVVSETQQSVPASVPGINEPSVSNTQSQPQPSGSSLPNDCGAGGGGIQVQWTGDVVSYSWPKGSGQTQGCLDLTGFEGQVAIGGTGGTILEVNPSNYFDISYILGYSVPVVCSGNGALTGCNIDLFGNGGAEGQVKKNPTGPGGARDPGDYQGCATCTPWCYACSAADPFFAPCAGSAYVYPYDDGATVGPATALTCCVGTSCPTTGREGDTKGGNPQMTRDPPCGVCAGESKRSVDQLEHVMAKWERDSKPLSPSLVPKRHKRHGHRVGMNPYSPILGEHLADLEQVEIDSPMVVGASSKGIPLAVVPMTGGSVKSEPGFSPAIDATWAIQGTDYIHNDPNGKHMRLNAQQVVKDNSGSLIYLNYNGVVAITPELAAILDGNPNAKSTEFGYSFIEMKFETGDEKFKDLELGMFVGAGRFIVEQGLPVTVEYKISKVVKGS